MKSTTSLAWEVGSTQVLVENYCDAGFALSGRETVETFKKLRFGEQVDAIKQDLVERFWKLKR